MVSNFDEINLISSFYDNPIINNIKKDQKNDSNLILAFVANLLLVYLIEDNKLKLTDTERMIESIKATELIDYTFVNQIKNEIYKTTDILKETMSKRIDFLNGKSNNSWNVNNKDFINILDKTIESKNYSDRIYDNKNQVAKILKKEIKDFIDGKTSVNEIKDRLQKKFNLNNFNTDRLVENEISRVCRALDEQYFLDNNIQDLVYVGILDQKICTNCFNHDGKVYNVNDPNRPVLPIHPMCRCYYAIKE